jgi:hypothetical protein
VRMTHLERIKAEFFCKLAALKASSGKCVFGGENACVNCRNTHRGGEERRSSATHSDER